MPSSEYKHTISGGLKLKGAKDAGVKKPKKKRDKDSTKPQAPKPEETASPTPDDPEGSALQKALKDEDAEGDIEVQEATDAPVQQRKGDGKTEAQRRHEEMRRKRLDERLKREGVKTHKERVEALNKYLSTLSEHHDMPRIGPG